METETERPQAQDQQAASVRGALAVGAATVALAACGGGGGGAGDSSGGSGSGGGVTPPVALTDADAARFLSQAAVGITRAQIARVKAIGYSAWIDEQMAMAGSGTRWDWLKAKGYDAAANIFTQNGFDNVSGAS